MSFSTDMPAEARDAWRQRDRQELAALDLKRDLRRLVEAGYSAREIGRWLWLSEEDVAAELEAARGVSMPVEGFSGALPREICQRYAVGMLSRERLVDELTRWEYAPGGRTDGYDTLIIDPPGAWGEVEDAYHRGWIDIGVYEEVFNRRHGIGAGE